MSHMLLCQILCGSFLTGTRPLELSANRVNQEMFAIRFAVVIILPVNGVFLKNYRILFMNILAGIIHFVINCNFPSNICTSFLVTNFGFSHVLHSNKPLLIYPLVFV